MTLKAGNVAIALLAITTLGLGAFFFFNGYSVPNENEILARIATLEKQPLPSSCPQPTQRDGLHVQVAWVANVYKKNRRYEKATPYFLRAIEIQKQLCGADYPGLIGPMSLLAENYELAGIPDKAATLRQEIRAREERLLRENPELSSTCRAFHSVLKQYKHTQLGIRPVTFEYGWTRIPGCVVEFGAKYSSPKEEVNIHDLFYPSLPDSSMYRAGWTVSNEADLVDKTGFWVTKGSIVCSVGSFADKDDHRVNIECAVK